MTAFNLYTQMHESTHFLSFWTSSGDLKPFRIELEVFVPKTMPKICNNFTDTYDMEMKLCWLTEINIHL